VVAQTGAAVFFNAVLDAFWPVENGHDLEHAGVAMQLQSESADRTIVRFRLGAFIRRACAIDLVAHHVLSNSASVSISSNSGNLKRNI
jgi:hypothetical protein